MEKCLYKKQLIIASDVASDYAIEEEIRKAGQTKQLFCADPDCGQPVMYCRGAVVSPHFRHFDNSICNYNEFSKKKNVSIDFINARKAIYNSLSKKYEVQLEAKVSSKHWCDLAIMLDEDVILPIELVDKYMAPTRYNSVKESYSSWTGIEPLFIIISDLPFSETELDTNVVERSQLYENYKTLIRYYPQERTITIYYLKYEEGQRVLVSNSYPLHFFYPDKLSAIQKLLGKRSNEDPQIDEIQNISEPAVEKTVAIDPKVISFYEGHPDLYPMTYDSCSRFFYIYFTNSGKTINKRIFASFVIKAGYYCDKESAETIKSYITYQKDNKPDFYEKIIKCFSYIDM